MWFMSNRNKKQQRKAGDFRANLEVGQDVMTGSGLYGTIVGIEDDVITLESTPGNASRWIRAAISKVIEPPVLESDAEDTDDVEDFTDEADDDFESESSERTLDVPDDLSSLTETPRKDDDTTDKK
jgi:preprotein translocase subunit YajC